MAAAAQSSAVVVGVGAEVGLGGALCKRFAREGHRVFVAGRSADKLARVATAIENAGGSATAVVCDATREADVVALFDAVAQATGGAPDLVVYNVGNSTPGAIREMDAAYFENAWRLLCFGGFLVGREVSRRLPDAGATLIFTGASASLRGKAGFAAFNAGKAALRTFAQALAKEYAAQGLHVAHVVIDGGIAGEKQFQRLSATSGDERLQRLISLDGLADAYWNLYRQSPRAWSFEIDLRTSLESW